MATSSILIQGLLLIILVLMSSATDTQESGQNNYTAEGNIYYKVYSEALEWKDARNVCNYENATLIWPRTQEELKALQKFVPDKSYIWLGVYVGAATWTKYNGQLIDDQLTFYGGRNGFYGNCTTLLSIGQVSSVSCWRHKYNVICEWTDGNSSCPASYERLQNIGCYKHDNSLRTVQEARQICEEDKSELAVPDTDQELTGLLSLMRTYNLQPWIGIIKSEDVFITPTGETFNVSEFIKGQQEWEGACLSLSEHGLECVPCDLRLPFVCQKEGVFSSVHTQPPVISLKSGATRLLGRNGMEFALLPNNTVTFVCTGEQPVTWSIGNETLEDVYHNTFFDASTGKWGYYIDYTSTIFERTNLLQCSIKKSDHTETASVAGVSIHVGAEFTCRADFDRLPGRGCFSFHNQIVSWQEAADACLAEESQLASPTSLLEIDAFSEMAWLVNEYNMWMGIKCSTSSCETLEGESISGNEILRKKLGPGCVYLSTLDGLMSTDCSAKLKFICMDTKVYGLLPDWAVALLGVSGILLVILTAYVLYSIRTQKILRKKLREAGVTVEGCPDRISKDLTVVLQAQLLPIDKRWEFPLKDLRMGSVVGAGEFGTVMKADAYFIKEGETISTVAVKVASKSDDIEGLQALTMELKILAHLGQHLNVVNLLGACTRALQKGKLLMIVDFCQHGNLQQYLLRHRNEFMNLVEQEKTGLDSTEQFVSAGNIPDSTQVLFPSDCNTPQSSPTHTVRDLICWSYQVAKGMDYLSSRKVLHGDLAARNVLLADDNVVKICDFGLARNLNSSNYCRKKDDKLPVKWLSPEALMDQIFSIQSDVWAFGILLWEIFSCAATPYPGLMVTELIGKLQAGYRLEQPKLAPDYIYDAMLMCWKADPTERPSFSSLVYDLGNLLGETVVENYVSLNEPYMKLNIERSGRDYLAEMKSPDFNDVILQVDVGRESKNIRDEESKL